MNDYLPWHAPQWDNLLARRTAGRLPHALLLCGVGGLGKQLFATQFAQALLCSAPKTGLQACGDCKSCRLFLSGNHPDMHVVQPESVCKAADNLLAQYAVRYQPQKKTKDSKDSIVIRIDEIRALIESNQTRPQLAATKVVILAPADTLTTSAANSLLKTLEEPAPDTVIMLVTDRPASLPATIRSRCQRVLFHIPDTAQSLAWLRSRAPGQDADTLLALAGGAPLRALALAQGEAMRRRTSVFTELAQVARAAADPLTIAAGWLKSDLRQTLDWLGSGVMDMIRLRSAGPVRLVNRDLAKELQRLADGLDLTALYGHLDRLTQAVQLADSSVNTQLLLEDILIPWIPERPSR